MKKRIAVMAALLQLAVAAQPALGEFKAVEAKIVYIKGRAEVMRKSSVAWVPAMLKMKLYAGDKIACDNLSETEIALDDGSVLKLRDKSLLELERMDKQKKPVTTITSIKATSGKVLGCIRKLASKESRFTVSTPTAVAGIRGTVFAVMVEGDTTELDVLKGQVGVAGTTGAEVMVNEKMMTTVVKGDSAKTPVAMTVAKLAFIAAWAGAAIKIGSLGAAAATAWYATTPAIVGGAAAAVATTAVVVIVATKKDQPPPPPAGKPSIPAPPGWPQ